ncbi:MAG TPA: SCO family protein [Phycisphaerae bacterium]|nr:SCO family protein [Phycisphaerae bacterium]
MTIESSLSRGGTDKLHRLRTRSLCSLSVLPGSRTRVPLLCEYCGPRKFVHLLVLVVVLLWATAPQAARAQVAGTLPKELEGVGITERPDAQIPLNLEFKDDDAKAVTLGDYFKGDRPVLLTLNYYRCPMLCTLQLNGLVEALKNMPWTAGEQFEIVTVSFDPRETPQLGRLKKQNYLEEYGRPASAGWHFLVGQEENIKKLADTVGFQYRYDKESDQYYHVACAYVCTPSGRVSRYLYGVMYDPRTLRLSLLEAGQGKIGTTVDQVLLYCFHYDPNKGSYTWAAMNLMRVGGITTLLVFGIVLWALWRRDLARSRKAAATVQAQNSSPVGPSQ